MRITILILVVLSWVGDVVARPTILYENTRSLVYQHDQFGVTWTMGFKGSF